MFIKFPKVLSGLIVAGWLPAGRGIIQGRFDPGPGLGHKLYRVLRNPDTQQPQHDALPGHSLVLDNIHPEYPPHISNQQEVKINH